MLSLRRLSLRAFFCGLVAFCVRVESLNDIPRWVSFAFYLAPSPFRSLGALLLHAGNLFLTFLG